MPIIQGKKVYLRNPIQDDSALWTNWLNDYDLTLSLGDEVYSKITEDSIKKQISEYQDGNYFIFTIVKKEDKKAIGRVILFGIDQINAKGTIGIFLGDKESREKGYAKEALELLIEYSFSILNLHSIMLGVFEFNKRAINLYKKLGFKEIGIRRDARKINGKYHNAILMDILDSEYENKYLDFSIFNS